MYIKKEEEVAQLEQIVREQEIYSHIDFHLMYSDGGPYPINTLRNIAMDNAKTDYFIILDVDFKPGKFLYEESRYLSISHAYLDYNS